jgi:hypothetical protein
MTKVGEVITIWILIMSTFAQTAVGATINRAAFDNCVNEAITNDVENSNRCLTLDAACRRDLQGSAEWTLHFTCDTGVKSCLDTASRLAALQIRECVPSKGETDKR